MRAAARRRRAAGTPDRSTADPLPQPTRSRRPQPVDLAAITAAAAAAADHDGLTLATTLHPAETSGDPRLVERLVANLVSNAIRHNVAGGRIDLATETRDGRALLTVTNTGPAVPAGQLDRLFQPFQRLAAARTADSKGLGLGLSIVKAIADAHDATIATHPRPVGGLHIEVSFPAAVSHGGPDRRGRLRKPARRGDPGRATRSRGRSPRS